MNDKGSDQTEQMLFANPQRRVLCRGSIKVAISTLLLFVSLTLKSECVHTGVFCMLHGKQSKGETQDSL